MSIVKKSQKTARHLTFNDDSKCTLGSQKVFRSETYGFTKDILKERMRYTVFKVTKYDFEESTKSILLNNFFFYLNDVFVYRAVRQVGYVAEGV